MNAREITKEDKVTNKKKESKERGVLHFDILPRVELSSVSRVFAVHRHSKRVLHATSFRSLLN